MKKSVTHGLMALFGLVMVGAGGAWFVASGNAVSQAEKRIAELNAKVLPQQGRVTLTYDRLSRSGFPAVGVRLANPVVTANIPADAQGRPAIDAVWKRDGNLDIVTDYLNHEYRITSDGAGTLNVTSGAEKVATSSDASHLELTIAAKDRAAFAQWDTLAIEDAQALRQALKHVAALKLSVSPLVIKDANSNAVIYMQDASTITLANRSMDGLLDFDLDMALNGMEATKEYGLVAQRLVRALQLPELGWDEAHMPFSATRAGKQEVALSMQVKMPETQGLMANGFVRIPTLRVKNDFYSFEMPLHVEMKEENAIKTALIQVDTTVDVAPAAAGEMQKVLDMFIGQEGMDGMFMRMTGAPNTDIDRQVFKQKLTEALPTMTTLGPVTFTMDVEASLPSEAVNPLIPPAKDTGPTENLTIRALSFNHARWGLDVKGMAARPVGAAPTVDVTLTCKRCETMTKDLYDTAKSAQEAMNISNPERPQWPISEALLANVNTTLADIGNKDGAGDITFGISSPTAGDYRINDKPMEEVLPKLMTVFASTDAAQHAPALDEAPTLAPEPLALPTPPAQPY